MIRYPLTLILAIAGGFSLVVGITSGSLVWIAAGAVLEIGAAALVWSRLAARPLSVPLPQAPVGSRVVLQPGAGRVSVDTPPADQPTATAAPATPEETR